MSETFGLTGVEVESRVPVTAKAEPPKKIVTATVPKRNELPEAHKSSTKLPPIEPKKIVNQVQSSSSAVQPATTATAAPKNDVQSTQQRAQIPRAKSSKSMVNVRKIDTLRTFLDNARPIQSSKGSSSQKKADGNSLNGEKFQQKRAELEREKKENKKMFLEGYRQKIEAEFDALYKNDDYELVVAQLKQLEGKVKLQGEITRNERMVREDQKEFNSIKYEIEKKQKILAAIENQISSLQFVFTTEEEKRELAAFENFNEEFDQKLETETVTQLSLRNMVDTRKNLLLYEKKKSEQMYQEYLLIGQQIEGFEEKLIKDRQKHSTLDKEIQAISKQSRMFEMNSRFQELLEDELSEYEDKNALGEIFKHEQERKDELLRKDREIKKTEMEQLHFERQKHTDKVKQEQRQIEQVLNQKRKNMEELLKVSCVSDISELELRKQFLEESNLQLKWIETEYQDSIDSFKLEIGDLRKQLEELKYIQKEKSKGTTAAVKEDPNKLVVIDEENLTANVNIEKFEQVLIEETDKLQDKEGQVKRLERVVDEICLVFSRVLFQLQPQTAKNKNIEVKREDLRNQITICGLKLEKIISFLAKKKDSLRVESINTDADNFHPPEYVGINPRSYLRQRDIDEQREFEANPNIKFDYKEDDPNDFESDQFLAQVRRKVRAGPSGLQDIEEGEDTD